MSVFVIGKNGYIAQRMLGDSALFSEPVFATSSRPVAGELALDLSAPHAFDYQQIDAGDFVILLAAISSPDVCNQNYEHAYRINVAGTSEFIEKCMSRNAKVLFFSSDIVYGEQEKQVDEYSQCYPVGNYGAMKLEVENAYKVESNFKAFRLSYIFSRNDKYTGYLHQCAQGGKTAEIFHPILRRTVYIGDLIEAIRNIRSGWEQWSYPIFNIGGPQLMSRIDLADCYKQIVNSSLEYKVETPSEQFFKARPKTIDMGSMYFEQLLNHSPTTILDAMKKEFKGRV